MKHNKFQKVEFNNKKRVFILHYTSGLTVECPYSSLNIKKKVIEAAPDKEVNSHSFYFVLENHKKDFVPYDQPLHIVQHPEYMRREILFYITRDVKKFIDRSNISKREVARRLKTSVSQLSRLLDPTNYNKNLTKLLEIANLLNYEFEWKFKKAA